jgi:hypothetical protein
MKRYCRAPISPQTRWKEIIVLSTIGRKPTIVPVRGNVSNAGSAPWPVPKVKTSFSRAMLSAQTSAAASIAAAWVAFTCCSRSISVLK